MGAPTNEPSTGKILWLETVSNGYESQVEILLILVKIFKIIITVFKIIWKFGIKLTKVPKNILL